MNEPQSYAEMFQMIKHELMKQTDEYFKTKKVEFDCYVENKLISLENRDES